MRTIDNFPLVSIIVPIYNVELYVKECILSVFAQDYQNIELIAVDDCGTDNSIAILGLRCGSPWMAHQAC